MTLTSLKNRSIALIIGTCLAVSACGDHSSGPLISTMGAFATGLTSSADQSPDIRSQITAARLDALRTPLILVSIPERDALATMSIFAKTENIDDWRTADNSSLVLEEDIIVATRGLGADLFASDPGGLQDAVLAGNGRFNRVQRFLDGENRQAVFTFVCDVRKVAREDVDLIARNVASDKISERCQSIAGTPIEFTNFYWVSLENSQIVQSQQWINAEVGYVIIQHLKR